MLLLPFIDNLIIFATMVISNELAVNFTLLHFAMCLYFIFV